LRYLEAGTGNFKNLAAVLLTAHASAMNRPFALLLTLLLAVNCLAAETPADAQLKQYFRAETARLSAQCLADIQTLEDWTSQRAKFRSQYQEMLGLWPMPERTDLKPVVTGKLEHEEFTVEKLHFQASPGLYVTAALFLPKNLTAPAPTILYESGHWRVFTNGIGYGNKAVYQGRGAWFAQNGYVCLVLDTVLAGEIPGIHTGTRDRGLWWWNSRGYTPAGVEAWFGIRALDYLSTRPEVDTNRFGITGHSGGGAYSWALTALDDRIKVAAPLAGMADLHAHVVEGIMDSHCDCNFPINYYGWDFPQIAALAAPRPLLIGSTDNDRLFNLENTIRIHDKVRRIYQLHNATDKLGFAIAPGPHDEVPELQLAVLRWFNRHLKGDEKPAPVTVDVKSYFSPTELKVFAELPADAINTNIANSFVPLAKPAQRSAAELAEILRTNVFRGWPADDLPLEPTRVFSVERDGVRFSAWDFASQPEMPLRLYLLESVKTAPVGSISIQLMDERSWHTWLRWIRVGFEDQLTAELATTTNASPEAIAEAKWRRGAQPGTATAFFAPRGIGLTAWSDDTKAQTKIRRRFMALGQTLDGMRVWDIRRAIQMVHFIREADVAKVELTASGPMGVNLLYASLFESSVRRVELNALPKSHAEGPDYLGVMRFTDIPQVLEAMGGKTELR
jgi:dienelactone hydrolase